MQSFRASSRTAVALGGVLSFAAPGAVFAQAEGLEEIVVTALRRSEILQDAPATVTAFDAETIEEARIQSMRDYVNLTSNMTLMETQNNAFAFVNIRGLAQIRNVDPTVAVVIDGVLSTTSLGFSQDLYDVQQIEVLKGPQGALYGRNATGGAINITTKPPTNEPEGYIRGGFGNGDSVNLSGVASGPLVEDTLLGRIVVGYRDADGWRDNVATGVKADPYEDLTVAGKLLWNIAADAALDLRLTYSDTQSTGSQFVSNAPNFVTGFPGNAQYPGNGSAPPVPGLPASITALIGDPNNTSISHQGNEPGMDDREAVTLSAKLDWETAVGTLTSITSYDTLDHVTAAEQFAYYPFVTVAGQTGRGLASRERRRAGVCSNARRFRHGPELDLRPESLPRLVQPGAAHHVAGRWTFALDRRGLLRADRPRRDDLHQQRFRPRLRRAADGSEHRRQQPYGHLVTAVPRAADTDHRLPRRCGSESEHERERVGVQLRQQPQHGLRAVRADQLRSDATISSSPPPCATTATSASSRSWRSINTCPCSRFRAAARGTCARPTSTRCNPRSR